MPSNTLTKQDLENALERQTTVLTESIRGLNANFNESQSKQNLVLDGLADDMSKVKLAVLDYLATDRAVRNLVHELQAQGIKLDEKKIFAI